MYRAQSDWLSRGSHIYVVSSKHSELRGTLGAGEWGAPLRRMTWRKIARRGQDIGHERVGPAVVMIQHTMLVMNDQSSHNDKPNSEPTHRPTNLRSLSWY